MADEISQSVKDALEALRVLKAAMTSPEMKKALQTTARIVQATVDALEPFTVFVAEFMARQALNERVEQSGWLPHPLLPFDAFDLQTPVLEIDQIIRSRLSENIEAVEMFFRESASQYGIDDIVPIVMSEALECHRRGNYRAVVRMLFPEIERSVRYVYGLGPGEKGVASIREARNQLKILPLGLVSNHRGMFSLYQKLDRHLYMRVETPEALAVAEADPVPNRHAALHGLVDYSSMQNSMNMIIMADFIFRPLGAIYRQRREQQG